MTLNEQRFQTSLAEIAAGAEERDLNPRFPDEAFEALADAGALYLSFVDQAARTATYAEEWAAVRAVAKADASVGRIYDGHLNGIERLSLCEPDELALARRESFLLGVWGADPRPNEGQPAALEDTDAGPVLFGSKTFCSGAGGVDRALVMVHSKEGPPLLVYIDPAVRAEVDRGWFRGSGLRASESHMVTFNGTPVIATLGEPGELGRTPWFQRDAIRTAASWAGMADLAAERALKDLAERPPEDIASLAAGHIASHSAAIDLWLARAADIADSTSDGPDPGFSIHLREGISTAAMGILHEAARACGSMPFATGDPLDRSRRDLELFLLQHRLDPLLVKLGREIIGTRT